MKTIKTRETVKGIKSLDKPANLAKRMKDTFIRTKERAEETQNTQYSSATDYAGDKTQNAAQGTAQEAARHFSHPIRKSRDRFDRAKGHFEDAKSQMPKERRRVAEEAKQTAQHTKTNADKLRKTADKAADGADKAKDALQEAKNTLREVRQTGKQTMREAKQGVKTIDTPVNSTPKPNPARDRFIQQRRFKIKTREGVQPKFNTPEIKTASGGEPLKTPVSENPAQKRFVENRRRSIKTRESVSPKAESPVTNAVPKSGDMPQKGDVRLPDSPKSAQRSAVKGNQPKTYKVRRGEIPRVRSDMPQTPKSQPLPRANAVKGEPIKPISGGTPKGNALRPTYLNKGVQAPKNAVDTAKTVQTSAKSVKSTGKTAKQTAKGTIKTAKKSVKTAEKSAKATVKTAKHTAKTAQKTAQTAAKAAKAAEKAARAAAKAAAQATKATVKAITALVKATIAAIKGLVALIAAGGWVAVAVILIICLIGLIVGSCFGIFFSSEPDPNSGKTVNTVIAEINTEYSDKIDDIINSNAHDLLDMSGARAAWKEVLAVYTVKTVTDLDNPMEVATMTDEKADILRTVFWDMNSITHRLDTVSVEEDVIGANGLPTGETTTVSKTVLRIMVSHKTTAEMAAHYGFSDEQKDWLAELLKPEYHGMWNALLYGITSIGDGSLIEIADTQIGNVGGEVYWRWYGFNSRVAWCACFVSWCAEQCGFIDAGIIPRFSLCDDGITWFKNRGQWQNGGYTPAPGEIIFFDWEGDGVSDHVGIVEYVEGDYVHTIEGNTSDSCARRSYLLNSSQIMGYGIPSY